MKGFYEFSEKRYFVSDKSFQTKVQNQSQIYLKFGRSYVYLLEIFFHVTFIACRKRFSLSLSLSLSLSAFRNLSISILVESSELT